MAEVISLCNLKGGVAKTTTTIIMAELLSSMGKNVLVIDLDPQCSLTKHFLFNNTPMYSSFDVIARYKSFDEVVIHEIPFDILPASRKLESLKSVLDQQQSGLNREYRLADVIKNISKDYDFILIDNAPTLSITTIISLIASNKVIIPTNAAMFSLESVLEVLRVIDEIKVRSNKNLEVAGILITMYRKKQIATRIVSDMYQELSDKTGAHVFKTVIREGAGVRTAQAERVPLCETYPNSVVSIDYKNFVKEYLNEE